MSGEEKPEELEAMAESQEGSRAGKAMKDDYKAYFTRRTSLAIPHH